MPPPSPVGWVVPERKHRVFYLRELVVSPSYGNTGSRSNKIIPPRIVPEGQRSPRVRRNAVKKSRGQKTVAEIKRVTRDHRQLRFGKAQKRRNKKKTMIGLDGL